MKGIRNFLAATMVAGIAGCELSDSDASKLDRSRELIKGTVVGEIYTIGGLEPVDAVSKRGVVSQAYSNPTVTIGESIYIIKLKLDDSSKIIALNVIDDRTKKEALDSLVEEGTRIGFKRGNLFSYTQSLGKKHLSSDRAETGFYKAKDDVVTRKVGSIDILE